ncbi:uncharacterized protein C8Q71DRAFT_723550 [Rhodofomes roseus]|uniref:Uncharacterized protein n=1 Tax=Rhodofomes roseus TaxID=34475 RepID=A0ABQ8KHC2_9APHY|nr:uncharacterized protein C8Q71DRAFT_723550 [Rhodofomes roseus]KAH9837261.1 hypothetical protein C8Q71DRAFT_723550 [Rhodofomes roseus]
MHPSAFQIAPLTADEQQTAASTQSTSRDQDPNENNPTTRTSAGVRTPSPRGNLVSPVPDELRSFADVTAGRPATPLPQAFNGMPCTPRLRPIPDQGLIPHLDLTATGADIEHEQVPPGPNTGDYPPLTTAPATPAPSLEPAKNKKAAKKNSKAKQQKAADAGNVTPPTTSTPLPNLGKPAGEGRRRRRAPTKRTDESGEASQPRSAAGAKETPAALPAPTLRTPASISVVTTIASNVSSQDRGPDLTRPGARETQDDTHDKVALSVRELIAQPPHPLHPFSEWDPVNGGFIWNPPPMQADPHWRPNTFQRGEDGPPPDASQNSFYAPSLDEMIRSYQSPPPGLSTLTPAPRPPRDPLAPDLPPILAPPAPNNGSHELQPQPETRRPALHAEEPGLASALNDSVLAPPWHKDTGRRNFAADVRYRPYPSSTGRQLSIAAPVSLFWIPRPKKAANIPYDPQTPRRPSHAPQILVPETPTPLARPSGLVSTPRPDQQPAQRGASRASILSYVTNRPASFGHPSPIDVDAMSIDGDGIEIIEPPRFQSAQPTNANAIPPQNHPLHAYPQAPPQAPLPPAFQQAMFEQQAAPEQPGEQQEHDQDAPDDFEDGPASGIDWANVEFTKEPEGGWRKVQFLSPDGMFEGQSEEQVKQWRILAENVRCVMVAFAMHGACDKDSEHWARLEFLIEVLKYRFGVRDRPLLAPEPAPGRRSTLNTGPWYFLLPNVTDIQQFVLENFGWCSSRYLTVHFTRFPPPPPDLLVVLDATLAFMTTEPEAAKRIVAANFRREPLYSTTIDTIKEDKAAGAKGKWGNTPVMAAFRTTVESIEVRVMPRKLEKGSPNPLFVVYCDPPTTITRLWLVFRDAVRRQPFRVEGGCPATVYTGEQLLCKLCHSMDHKVGLCDLPKLDDWHGPRPADDDHKPKPAPPHGGNGHGKGKKRYGGQNFERNRGRNTNATAGSSSNQSIEASMHAALTRETTKKWYGKK